MDVYGELVFVRRFLEKVHALYRQGHVHGPAHVGIGQEAIAVGVARALRPEDRSIGTYRGHAHALARGAPPDAVLRELLGREGGICAGKGGSMHITSVEYGYFGSYAIVGAHLPIACGLALADQLRSAGRVTVCFFGDGTTNIGAFHEAVNLAAVWGLPVVFVCENNGYMEYTPIGDMTPVPRPAADRAGAYGLRPITVDGNDVRAVRDVTGEAVEAARAGQGPAMIEARTYRMTGHSCADPGKYQPPDEVERWAERDPLLVHRAVLVDAGVPAELVDEIDSDTRTEVDELAADILAAAPITGDNALTDMWSDGGARWRN
ncbi:MAG: pyruvate dehydrogenase (acetyl-transferring) E1 component subunit alpha [Actinophytocola sp.]|nr:pyruvate dehydrogenase (acetyl-transferring) E1 component subunit alpha [Actinophytocola sp.]